MRRKILNQFSVLSAFTFRSSASPDQLSLSSPLHNPHGSGLSVVGHPLNHLSHFDFPLYKAALWLFRNNRLVLASRSGHLSLTTCHVCFLSAIATTSSVFLPFAVSIADNWSVFMDSAMWMPMPADHALQQGRVGSPSISDHSLPDHVLLNDWT